MSLLLMFFYWLILPGIGIVAALWLWQRAKDRPTKIIALLLIVPGFVWLLWTVWGGDKFLLDRQVRELCAKDGGIKVYETVKLPADKFNQWGQPNFYKPDQGVNALGNQYMFRSDQPTYASGQNDPRTLRYHYEVVRRSDMKLLGETTSYGRIGADLPGPWHGSSFHCPSHNEASEIALLTHIFVPMMGEQQ